MKTLLLALLLVPQAPPDKHTAAAVQLKKDFIEAGQQYKSRLLDLIRIYEHDLQLANNKLVTVQGLYKEGLASGRQVSDAESDVNALKARINKAHEESRYMDEEIKSLPSDKDLAKEFRRASKSRRTCENWNLTAYRRQRQQTIEIGFRVVCKASP